MSEPRRKTFTFEEARALLPEVRERTRRAVEALSSLTVPVDDGPQAAEETQTKAEKAVAQTLSSWASEIEELGIEVKGPWLVDFDSGAGYYCWKWPEESLSFFHGYQEGFSGRIRLQ